MNEKMTTPLVNVKACPTLEEAQRLAGSEAANTGAFSIPVVVFRQGKRTVVSGALPMSWVKSRLESRSAKPAKKGGSMADSQSALNRPEDPQPDLLQDVERPLVVP